MILQLKKKCKKKKDKCQLPRALGTGIPGDQAPLPAPRSPLTPRPPLKCGAAEGWERGASQ